MGPTLFIANTLSRAPLPDTSHEPNHDEMVYRLELESISPDLSGFQDATLQDLRAVSDPEQIELRNFIESGWPAVKRLLPQLVHPYWAIRHELKYHEGLLQTILRYHSHFSLANHSTQASCSPSWFRIHSTAYSELFVLAWPQPVRSLTCVCHVLHVHNMLSNTRVNLSSLIQCLLCHGSWSVGICLS